MDSSRTDKRKAWAEKFGLEKTPSMKRRKPGHDYQSRCVYLITVNVARGLPPLATVHGPDAEHARARVEPTALGRRVTELWENISAEQPLIKSIAFTLMPDHVHGILFVTGRLPRHLSHVIARFKAKTTAAWRESILLHAAGSSHVGSLWEDGYNDRILRGEGELQRWIDYLRDNPRRRWIKVNHPEYFTSRSGIIIDGTQMPMMGNRSLLSHPCKAAVRCSRRQSEEEIERECCRFLSKAAEDAVLVSPCISPCEKAVMRRAFDAGYPLIIVLENGFAPRQKPSG